MTDLSLFDSPKFGVTLRPYQSEQMRSVMNLWRENQSVLLVSSVGSGKTTTFSSIVAERSEGRSLILAHRSELVTQAIDRLRLYDIHAARDQAEERAEHGQFARDVIVGTVQTVKARLPDYDPFDFTTVIVDEAHHCCAKSYRWILDHFRKNPECKILGVTGTPDRSDEEALGQIFDAVADPVFGIEKAVAEGWLVNPLQQMIEVEGLDLSRVRTTAGDLNAGDMAEILEREEVCQGIASGAIQNVGDMRTLVFAATVKEAELLCDIFNRHRGGCAGWVCGKTPEDLRREVFKHFETGEFQFFVNVGIATEGTDMPHVRCVANARMTKSRSLYEQISGRALRTFPGCVDGVDTIEERLAAIAASPKPNALLLDFVGNSGKHKLMTVADILGGNISDEMLDIVNERIRKKGKPSNVAEEIEKLRKEIEERKAHKEAERQRRKGLVADAKFSAKEVNPFDSSDVFYAPRGWDGQSTPEQCKFLEGRGFQNCKQYTKRQASAIISKEKAKDALARNGLGVGPSSKQETVLIKCCGFTKSDIEGMAFKVWKSHIDEWFACKKNGKQYVRPEPSFTERMITEDIPPPEYESYGEPAF